MKVERMLRMPRGLLPLLKEYKTMRGNKGMAFFQMKGERRVTLNYLRDLMGHKSLRESNPCLHASAGRLRLAIEEHPAHDILSELEAQR
ncbi:MAG: hypothetical protein AB2L14_20335 [Candidatus Xenobiia bacterium LiM19]